MLLALVDSLRCPAAHEDSPLVLSVEEWAGQRVSRGLLGCPACHARYPIEHGVAIFTGRTGVRQSAAGEAPDVLRLAAQLALAEPGGTVLLTGRYADCHEALSEMTGVTCLLVDAAPSISPAAASLVVSDRLPLIDGSLRGAAVDAQRSGAAFLAEVVRCLRSTGRLVVPRQTQAPHGTMIVADDDRECVSERIGIPQTVPIRRGPPR